MAKSNLTDNLKNISEKDRKQIEQAQEMLGPDPETMGFVKNLFWGNYRSELIAPFPAVGAEETARCDQMLAELDEYLRNEHPSAEVDQTQQIPDWCIKRLFQMGVMGMIVPKEYGGGGFGVTSYNRVLERIGMSCGSTAVMVSAHQSIGCGAIALFGTDEQKQYWLPKVSQDTLSAFCLSEPNVGCDAAGQETRCEVTEDGEHYILNGEKKWATSGALAGMFTVMCKQNITDPKTGRVKDQISALICTPDMEGIKITSRNRSKCGIRGTWQARMTFKDVKVPRGNLLHREGRGLKVALTCLNWGRCTLSAGMVGAGKAAFEQAMKWARYRYQFDRAIGEFELVREKLAYMSAMCYAMDAMLYMTTGIVDREDEDIMLETAICKVFCSEMGFACCDDALQIMGGEGYMTENVVERLWRDSRINTIVEGANQVMHTFVFAYGSKQLGEYMLGIKAAPLKHLKAATKIAAELFLHIRRAAPRITGFDPSLRNHVNTLEASVREFSHQVKMMFKVHGEDLITSQTIQKRLSSCVIWIHAMSCALSQFDRSIREGVEGSARRLEQANVDHIFALGVKQIRDNTRSLGLNTDDSMRLLATELDSFVETLPDSDYFIPERTPVETAQGKGLKPDHDAIPQFGEGSAYPAFRAAFDKA
ncbi:MAG: acyl-CoA dehydrogenase family protein [Phycisphaerales bacterium]|nr:acyl-CoA dehydrogenase family protein [Phycisphaerales bacterium]